MADYFWSCARGEFVDKVTGERPTLVTFTGSVIEWYETLIEVMADVSSEAVRNNGFHQIFDVSWRVDPAVFRIVACSVMFMEQPIEIGVLGAPRNGLLKNIPVHESLDLIGTGKAYLIEGLDRKIGSVSVLDLLQSAH